MDDFVIFTRHSPWTFAFVNTLIARNCTPKGIIFEGGIHDTWHVRCLRCIESLLLTLEHTFFFRRHEPVHKCYRRHGSIEKLLREQNILYHTTNNHNDPDCEAFLKQLKPQYILLSGTRMIKPHILAIPTKGTLNAHSAMLPNYRGAKSEYWILSKKDYEQAGVTIHWVDAKLDTGELCLQEKISVSKFETTKTLRAKSVYLSAHLFAETLRRLAKGESLRERQGQGTTFDRPDANAVKAFDASILRSME